MCIRDSFLPPSLSLPLPLDCPSLPRSLSLLPALAIPGGGRVGGGCDAVHVRARQMPLYVQQPRTDLPGTIPYQ
eukprot:1063310-Rhodomonas_salina.1